MGTRREVLRAIRACTQIGRLVYVTSNTKSLVRDAGTILVKTTITETESFRPTRAFGFDMFPHIDELE
jgi:tRNA/tmRNA/rRNA uracil-C5-methylase (TrmA/RlmC/RlmD family)